MNCSNDGSLDFEDIFGFSVAFLNLLLILLVLCISRQLRSTEISRIYTVFLFVSYIPSEVISLLYDGFRCAGLIDTTMTYFPDINWFYIVYKLSRTFAQSQYELLALVMAFMSYSLFTNPTRFDLYFGNGQAVLYLSAITALSLLSSVLCVIMNVVGDDEGLWVWVFLYFLSQATILIPFVLMLCFYVLACIAIHRYSKMAGTGRHRKYQLISVLAYCTPPNILNTVVIAICCWQLTQFFTDWSDPSFYGKLRTAQWFIEKIRLLFLTTSTLLAFSNYRNFVIAKCIRRKQTKVLAISSIQTTTKRMGCPMEFLFDDGFAIATPVINLALIASVLLISLRIKAADISRTYTIFLFVSYIPAEIAGLYYAVLSCTDVISRRVVFFPEINWWFYTYKVQRSFAQSQYELLALVMASISYSLFASPTRFNHYFGNGKVKHYFIGVTCLSLVFSALGVLISVTNDRELHGAARVLVLAVYTLLQLAIILPFAMMVVLYCLALKAIWDYQRVRTHVRSEKDRRSQLISVLVYCTPPNLLNVLVIYISVCQLHRAHTGHDYPSYYHVVRTVQWYSEKGFVGPTRIPHHLHSLRLPPLPRVRAPLFMLQAANG